MASTTPEPQQVRMDALRTFHDAILRSLAERAPKAGAPTELAAEGLSLQCEQCGIQISGAEWLAVLQAEDPTTLRDARLERFQQGYCGRKDCQSYYYRVGFKPIPDVDWNDILKLATEQPAVEVAPPAGPPSNASLSRRKLAIRLAIGGGIILILLLIRRLWTGGSIPVLRPAKKYTVDPSSVPPAIPPAK